MELLKIVNYTKVNAITWDVDAIYFEDCEFNTLTIHTCLENGRLTFSAFCYESNEIEALTKDIGDYLEEKKQVICTNECLETYRLPVTHHYRIFQLAHNDQRLFAGLTKAEDVDFGRYVCVWHEEVDHEINQRDLDRIYTKFNTDRPYNFGGHSLSVGDIVEVFDADENFNQSNFRYFYCDSLGWAELPIKKIKNNLTFY